MDVYLYHKEKNMRKIVTICGSLRFFDRIQEIAERLELENGYQINTEARLRRSDERFL